MNTIRIALVAVPLLLGATATSQAQSAQDRLWDAAMAGDTTTILAALADGAVIDSLDVRRSQNGRRALNWAALNNRPEALKVLIRLEAPLQAVNLTGFTALHHAAEMGAMESAHVLIDAGADPQHLNHAGETPADVAAARGFDEVAAFLRTAAQKPAKLL